MTASIPVLFMYSQYGAKASSQLACLSMNKGKQKKMHPAPTLQLTEQPQGAPGQEMQNGFCEL